MGDGYKCHPLSLFLSPMKDFELRVPAYYVVSPSLDEKQLNEVRHALKITPVTCAIVSDVYDIEFARQFVDEVLCSPDPRSLAESLDIPSLVITRTNTPFTSVYRDPLQVDSE